MRRSWYSVLPVLDTTGRRRVKKAVVCVAQLVAALSSRFMAGRAEYQLLPTKASDRVLGNNFWSCSMNLTDS